MYNTGLLREIQASTSHRKPGNHRVFHTVMKLTVPNYLKIAKPNLIISFIVNWKLKLEWNLDRR